MILLSLSKFIRKTPGLRVVATVKFAIPVLLLFTLAMIFGTVSESLYGGEYARRAVYHTFWFYSILGGIFVSVLLAMLVRFPYQKRLTGFYCVHTGILILMLGSVVTRYYGVDGTIELTSTQKASSVRVNEDYFFLKGERETVSYVLPYVSKPIEINKTFEMPDKSSLTLLRYFPFAKGKKSWVEQPGSWGTQWKLNNSQFSQAVILELNSNEQTTQSLGPLTVSAVPREVIQILESSGTSQKSASSRLGALKGSLMLSHRGTGKSWSIPREMNRRLEIKLVEKGEKSSTFILQRVTRKKSSLTYFELQVEGKEREKIRFFPRFSQKPVDESLKIIAQSDWVLIDLEKSYPSNTVLVAREQNGDFVAAMGKQSSWKVEKQSYVPGQAKETKFLLPWMGFEMVLTEEHFNKRSIDGYEEGTPHKEEEKNFKALEFRAQDGKTSWATSLGPSMADDLQSAWIGAKEVPLPFSMRLKNFKMDVVPGTKNSPASYESFVNIQDQKGTIEQVHIYMNHPYKNAGYTFYQSSYLQDESGQTHSILSVNKDPGRPIKSAGSILLLFGFVLHFLIAYKKIPGLLTGVFLLASMFQNHVIAQESHNPSVSALCESALLRDTPVLADGRAMPLFVLAQKTEKYLFSKVDCAKLNPVQRFCYLSWVGEEFLNEKHGCHFYAKIEHQDTAKLLGLKDRHERVSYIVLKQKRAQLLQVHQESLEAESSNSEGLRNDLASTLHRMDRYSELTEGSTWKLLTGHGQWKAVSELSNSDLTADTLQKSINFLPESDRKRMKVEELYETVYPFHISFLLGIFVFLMSLLRTGSTGIQKPLVGFSILFLLAQVFAITLRVLVSERAPVTNMYETVVWVGLGASILGFVLFLRFKDVKILSASVLSNLITLMLSIFSNKMLESSISPLVPVLRDNFWLSTHVTSITTSYGCFFLAFMIANGVLIARLIGNRSEDLVNHWSSVIRLILQIGSVFLALGVILGGVWADYSWGRFWGWDPKETWSLIALIIYMVILHCRYTGWLKGIYFPLAASAAFLSIIMAWFGVNYILAVGLHSYGFSSSGATFIGTVIVLEMTLVTFSWINEWNFERKRN